MAATPALEERRSGQNPRGSFYTSPSSSTLERTFLQWKTRHLCDFLLFGACHINMLRDEFCCFCCEDAESEQAAATRIRSQYPAQESGGIAALTQPAARPVCRVHRRAGAFPASIPAPPPRCYPAEITAKVNIKLPHTSHDQSCTALHRGLQKENTL